MLGITIIRKGVNMVKQIKSTSKENKLQIILNDDLKHILDKIVEIHSKNNLEFDLNLNFGKFLKSALDILEKEELCKQSEYNDGDKCLECKKGILIIRNSKIGTKFLGCTFYPKCKFVHFFNKLPDTVVGVCEKCKNNLILKKTKSGKIFGGCVKYPECNNSVWDLNLDRK